MSLYLISGRPSKESMISCILKINIFLYSSNIFSGFFTQFYNSLQSTPFYRHFFDLPLIGWFSPLRELRAIDTKVCLKDFFNVKLEDYVESPRVIHPSEILAGVKI